jgi:hypothetical protein
VASGAPPLSAPGRRVPRGGAARDLLEPLAGPLALVLALIAGFGWMYALRAMGLVGFGPRVADALPLLQLAGSADQPLARVVVAWVTVGVIAGVAGARLARPARALLILAPALGLLALASDAAFAAAHTENLSDVVAGRVPGEGVLLEALLFTAGALLPAPRPSGRRRDR